MELQNESLGLHERRRRKEYDGPVNFSQIRRPCPSVRTDINTSFSSSKLAQMSPPETPMSLQTVESPQQCQSTLFHNYLRAFHNYDQPVVDDSDASEGQLVTATIRPGDLILVHSVHKNGWADGTVLTTGDRGWLPTNYCETFDHPYLRNLLNAMTQFWDLQGAGEEDNLSFFVRQDCIRGLIAGVRYLLEHANCLHRDAPLVQRNAGISRMRKGLLADLSTLVQMAKKLQDTMSESFAGEVTHVLVEDLVHKAFRVVTRAVGFVDLLAQEFAGVTSPKPHVPSTAYDEPAAIVASSPPLNTSTSTAVDSAVAFPPSPSSDNPAAATNEQRPLQQRSVEEMEGLRSPAKFRPASVMMAHRVSVVAKRDRITDGTLASEQLSRAHDECISHIGAFIGLYLHSRPYSELVLTTDRLVTSCNALLFVIDQVVSHDTQNTMSVKQARINFQTKLDELTKSTKDVFKFSDGPDDDIVMLPEQTNHLVSVGTSLIRTVGECVIRTRKLIEQVGDFELERAELKNGDETEAQGQAQAEAGAGADDSDESRTTPTKTTRLSTMFPLPPQFPPDRALTTTDVTDFAQPPHSANELPSFADQTTPTTIPVPLRASLPPAPRRSVIRESDNPNHPTPTLQSPVKIRTSSPSPARKCSVGTSVTGSTDTQRSNIRDSGITAVSEVSTRATTPDHSKECNSPDSGLLNSFGSLSSLQSAAATDDHSDVESQLLQKTYAHEITFNKDGQVTGGSLAALVEQLTTHDSAPDAQFVSAFFLTFRSFATPRELAQALLHRFDYVGETKAVGIPVRLRIYNVFKGWLEVYWNAEADRDALGDIRFFALHKLKPLLPQAGERLVELTRKVTSGYASGTFNGPLVSGVGKVSTSIDAEYGFEDSPPEPAITKHQLAALRNAAASTITDFEPLELARQLTLIASKTFCEIQPEELLSLEWTKKNTTRAQNVRHLCVLNTDLAHVVGDTILGPDDAKKRAAVIKHWSKVATQCLELNNYESLMAIMCSLNSSVVQRLKRTWEVVSKKTKARLDDLNSIVDFSRNHASLRRRLEKPVAPCLPFLGVYLTDLTFVDAGNPKLRELPNTASVSGTGEPVSVINFDKHMRMAKIIAHLQKFQVPYRLQPVPELQSWLQQHLLRMREGNTAMVGQLHRRSLVVEPKDIKALGKMLPPPPPQQQEGRRHTEPSLYGDDAAQPQRPRTSGGGGVRTSSSVKGEKFEFLVKAGFAFRMRGDVSAPPPTVVEEVEEEGRN